MATAQPNLAIFASGRGSNAQVLWQHCQRNTIQATCGLVVSNVINAPVLQAAQNNHIATFAYAHQNMPRAEHEAKILNVLREHRIQHVLLAGYMRVLSSFFLEQFWGKIINIHPSILPEFKGLHAVEQAHAAQRSIIGATVHYVDAGVDTGNVILQGSIQVSQNETAEQWAQQLLTQVEHVIYPRAVQLLIERGILQ